MKSQEVEMIKNLEANQENLEYLRNKETEISILMDWTIRKVCHTLLKTEEFDEFQKFMFHNNYLLDIIQWKKEQIATILANKNLG